MTGPDPAVGHSVVDGVDVDAVVAAVRGCASVDDLYGGRPVAMATYLPGRTVTGVRVDPGAVVVGVRARWGVPAADVAAQIRGALSSLVGDRRVDVVITDLTDPPDPGPDGSGGRVRVT